MFAVSLIAIISLLAFALSNATQKAESLRHSVANELRTLIAQDLQQAVVDYRKANDNYPSSINDLIATGDPRARNLGAGTPNSTSYTFASNAFTSDDWLDVKRAVVFATRSGLNAASQTKQIFKANPCDTNTDWETAAAWCPQSGIALYSAVIDPRVTMAREIAAQRERLGRTLYRFAAFYNGTRSFPNRDASDGKVDLSNSSDKTLSQIAYAGADTLKADSCSAGGDKLKLNFRPDSGGTGQTITFPLGCEDVFNVWGGGVYYQRPDQRSIRLATVSPYKSTGNPTQNIVIVQELNLNE